MRSFLLISAAVVAVVSFRPAIAEPDQTSANYWMPFCRQAAIGKYYQGNAYITGHCVGLLNGLSVTGFSAGVCTPKGVTPDQAVRVVVQYIDQTLTSARQERMKISRF
jgi:hypothetical protein